MDRMRAKLVRGWSQGHRMHTQQHVQHADVIPWPMGLFPSVQWPLSHIPVPVVYSGHTYKIHTHKIRFTMRQ